MAYEWKHTDPRGMRPAIEAAIARGAARGWVAGEESSRADLRALLVATFYLVDSFSTKPPEAAPATDDVSLYLGDRSASQFSSEERRNVVRTLLETWRTLVVVDRKSNTPITSDDVAGRGQFSTVGGGPPIPVAPVKEAGFGWPLAAVLIVGVTIQAGVVCYVADKVASVVDNELTRREATRQMVATHSVVLQVLSGHRVAEEAAGGELPLTAAEKAALKAVEQSQVQAQKAIKIELPSLFPNFGGNTGKKIVAAAESLGWGALAIAGLLAYAFFTKGK